jgi:anti-sigma factor RsiW
MCDFSGRVIAWLDGELPEAEAADVERHLQECAQCRGRLAAYQQVSGALRAYCDSIMVSRPGRKLPRWAVLASGAVAAAAVLFLAFPRTHTERAPQLLPGAVTAPAAVVETAPAPINAFPRNALPRRRAAPRTRYQQAKLPPVEPAIEIAIPAEAIFPPGAVPEGINFTADVTIAPDGSAQQIRLQPRLAGFERRP